MNPLRVLLIDGLQPVPDGIEAVAVRPIDTSEIREKLLSEFDIIAVGNHAGLGLEVMGLIPKALQSSVVVLSNTELSSETKRRYQTMGVKNFVPRGALFLRFLQETLEDLEEEDTVVLKVAE